MKIIKPQSIAYTATVTEEEITERMVMELLEQIGALDDASKPLPGVEWKVTRGTGRAGGYTILVTGSAPVRVALPRS